MKKLWCFLTVLLVLTSTPVYSSDFTLFGGLQRQGKLTLKSAAEGATSFAFDPKNFGVVGVRVGAGRVFGHEHTLGYSANFIDSNSKALILNSNLLIQAPLVVAKPYVTAGVGMIHTTGSGLSNIGSKLALNYGGGVKVSILGPVGARFDVRGYAIPSIQSQTLNILEVTLGVVVHF